MPGHLCSSWSRLVTVHRPAILRSVFVIFLRCLWLRLPHFCIVFWFRLSVILKSCIILTSKRVSSKRLCRMLSGNRKILLTVYLLIHHFFFFLQPFWFQVINVVNGVLFPSVFESRVSLSLVSWWFLLRLALLFCWEWVFLLTWRWRVLRL